MGSRRRAPLEHGGLYIHAEPPLDLNSWQWGLTVRLAVWQYNSTGGLITCPGAGGEPRWSMAGISGEQGPYFRYETADPQLHGPWVLADTAFATTSDGRALGGGSNPDFYALPGPRRAGEPTHVLNAGKGGSFRLCEYHSETNSLKNCTSRVYDVGPGDWSEAGQADSSGAVLQAGWIRCVARTQHGATWCIADVCSWLAC